MALTTASHVHSGFPSTPLMTSPSLSCPSAPATEDDHTFEITATGWTDEDIPLLYSFGYVMPGSDAETPLTEASNSPSTSSILGVGPEAASYQYTVRVVVSDAYAASSRADTDVTVRPYVPSASIAEEAGNMLAAAATSEGTRF